MARIQTETGVRSVQEDDYKGRKIMVATGYDARSDKWPVHVYIEGLDKKTRKVEGQWLADSQTEAFDEGFRIAVHEIDNGGSAAG